jgi:hypothetical protein
MARKIVRRRLGIVVAGRFTENEIDLGHCIELGLNEGMKRKQEADRKIWKRRLPSKSCEDSEAVTDNLPSTGRP